MDTVDVVIPARNEESHIGAIISVLKLHPAIGRVVVVIDYETSDETKATAYGALDDSDMLLTPTLRGKGQLVRYGLRFVRTDYTLFCDGDIEGLTLDHVSLLLTDAVVDAPFMTIGVPDIPSNYPTERIWAWPWVSGERCVPTKLVRPLWLHGYLMETQINQAAKHANVGLRFEWLTGLKSSYYMSERRITAMQEDADFGRRHGIL